MFTVILKNILTWAKFMPLTKNQSFISFAPEPGKVQMKERNLNCQKMYINEKLSMAEQFTNFYSHRHFCFDAQVTRFTFSAAIPKSLELKRSLIALQKAQSDLKKTQQSKFENLHPQSVKTGSNEKGLFHSNQF